MTQAVMFYSSDEKGEELAAVQTHREGEGQDSAQ